MIVHPVERGQKSSRTTVPQANPYQSPAVTWTIREEDEVFVLTDEDGLGADGANPQIGVARIVPSELDDMLTIVSAITQMLCQRDGELVVDKEPHAVFRTT